MIYRWTGQPFVDAGISAIMAWSKRKTPEEITKDDVMQVISRLPTIYTSEAWQKNMQSIFPNGALTNPSYARRHIEEFTKVLSVLSEYLEPLCQDGDCIACGARSVIRLPKNDKRKLPNKLLITRTYLPLTGSGTLLNFFPSANEGNDLCFSCALAVQCTPLVLYACGNLLLLHSTSPKIMRSWARSCLKNIDRQISLNEFKGCWHEGYKNPRNAMFHIIQKLILEYEESLGEEYACIRLYHFTNYNQGPDIHTYDLPAPVFRFLVYMMQSQYCKKWWKIVGKAYYFTQKGKEISLTKNEDEDRRNCKNSVYENLLTGRSILGYFMNRSTRLAYGTWDMVTIYLQEVKKMDQDRIDAVRTVADKIGAIIPKLGNGKKRLEQLERASHYDSMRKVLSRLVKDNLGQNNPTPLFTFDDYVKNLFPQGALGWRETQDLLLFRLYENLHAWLLGQELVTEDNEEEQSVSDSANN